MHAECYQNRWVWFLHVLDLWSMILYIIKNDLSLNSRVLVSNSPVYWWFSSKYPEINSVKCSLHASLLRNSHLFRQSWVFPFFPLKVVLCVKKCDLSRYTWLLLDRLLRLSHFCTRNAASLTVLDQALSVTALFSRASRLLRQLSCLHGQRHYFVIHLTRTLTRIWYDERTSRIREIFACGIQNPEIQNTALGIRNPTNDWHPESKFHWQTPGGSTWNPEYTAWMWQVLAVLMRCFTCLLGFYLLLAWGALQTCTVSFCSIFFFLLYVFVLAETSQSNSTTNDPCIPTANGPRHLAILR